MDKDTVNTLAHVARHEVLIRILYDHIIDGDKDRLLRLKADSDYHLNTLHRAEGSDDVAIDQQARNLVARFFQEMQDALETKDAP